MDVNVLSLVTLIRTLPGADPAGAGARIHITRARRVLDWLLAQRRTDSEINGGTSVYESQCAERRNSTSANAMNNTIGASALSIGDNPWSSPK